MLPTAIPEAGPGDSIYNTIAPRHSSDHRSQAAGRSERHEDFSSSLRSLCVLHSQHRAGCNCSTGTRWCAHISIPQQVMEGNGTQGRPARDGKL